MLLHYHKTPWSPVTNPAGMSQVGTRVDIGSQLLFVHETITIPTSSAGLTKSQGADYSFPHILKSNNVIAKISEFGFNYQLNPKTNVGMTLWGRRALSFILQPLATSSPSALQF
ncbi:MAG: hypothetical protein ACSLEN_05935 [Candidatus Malihini olakiniferum]